MKCLTLFISLVLYPILAHAVPQPYPIDIDSRARTAPSLEMNQGEPYTVRVTFKSGATNEDVSAAVPFLYWALTAYATNYVTSSWARVDGGTGGVVDFTFSAAALNTNGDLIYGVGANQTFRQGALRVRANPFTSGAASPTFTLSTNLAGWSFVNYPWIDGASITGANSNSVSVSGNSLLITVRTNFGTSDAIAPDLTALSNGVARAVTNAGTRVNGSPLTNGAALLVGTVREIVGTNGLTVSQASGPITIISAAAMLTNATGAGRLTLGISGQTVTGAVDVSGLATGAPIYSLAGYATGTPVYAVSGLGTDTYARTTAEWASNRANAAHSIASAAATGTPIYSVSGLATGTPIYSIAGLATGTPIYSVAGLATGTPLYAEAYTGSVGSLDGYMPSAAVTTAINALSFPLASGESVSQRVAAVEGAYISGANASNAFVSTTANSTMAGSLTMSNAGVALKINNGGSFLVTSAGDAYPKVAIDADTTSMGPGIYIYNSSSGASVISASTNNAHRYGPVTRAHGGPGASVTNWVELWDSVTLPDPRNLSAGTNAPADWVNPSLAPLSNAIVTAGASSTNFGLAIGAGATALVAQASAAGTNFALAVGAGATSFVLQAWATASNGLATAQAAQVQASNINAAAWSQIATGAVSMATNRINQISAISFVNNATIGDIDYGLLFTNGYPAYAQGSSRYSFYGTWNFSPSSYQTAAAQASYATNAIKLFAGIVTQNQITARNQAFFDGTNIWIGLGGTNSLRMGGVLNAY